MSDWAARWRWNSALVALCILTLPAVTPARASKPRLRLEWVDSGGCRGSGAVRAHLRDVELEGTLRVEPASAYRLVVDGKPLADPPVRDGVFEQADDPLWIALIIQASADLRADLDRIKAGVVTFIGQLPARSRLTVISYTWEVERRLSLGTPEAASRAVRGIEAGTEGGEVALVEAVQTGLRGLSAGPPFRRLVVVVSDGLDRNPKRDVFRALGDSARRLRAPIFPVAYSPIDERGPLLNLGEIAKRSLGTLRWARRPGEIEQQLRMLAVEVGGQRVLTFRVPSGCAVAHEMQIQNGALRSNRVRTEPSSEPAGRSPRWRRWLALGSAAVVLVLLVFVVRGIARRRRR